MHPARIIGLTSLAMIAFAGNSLLCRLALKQTHIDPASFTSVRLLSGALVLWLLTRSATDRHAGKGNWLSAMALFCYAAGFSFAYVKLSAGTGALLLFGSVQASMIAYGIWSGERLRKLQITGLIVALGGLLVLLLPGISAPPLHASLLMMGAGIAWGVYSLRGKGAAKPTQVTAGNFLRSVPMALILSLLMMKNSSPDAVGLAYAVASGALASGIGYAIWYTVLPALKATSAATVQLSVPVIAAVGGILFLGEQPSWRLALASVAVVGGIALMLWAKSVRAR